MAATRMVMDVLFAGCAVLFRKCAILTSMGARREVQRVRPRKLMKLFFVVGAILAVAANSAPVSAQDYPNRAVRIVVPYAPGGSVSLLAQAVGNKMSELMKQPVVVENRPGAGGNLGA